MALRGVCIPSATPLQTTNLSFMGGYQLVITSGLGMPAKNIDIIKKQIIQTPRYTYLNQKHYACGTLSFSRMYSLATMCSWSYFCVRNSHSKVLYMAGCRLNAVLKVAHACFQEL